MQCFLDSHFQYFLLYHLNYYPYIIELLNYNDVEKDVHAIMIETIYHSSLPCLFLLVFCGTLNDERKFLCLHSLITFLAIVVYTFLSSKVLNQ